VAWCGVPEPIPWPLSFAPTLFLQSRFSIFLTPKLIGIYLVSFAESGHLKGKVNFDVFTKIKASVKILLQKKRREK